MISALDTLTPAQRALLDQWLPGAELVADRSDLHRTGTTALVLASGEDRFLVKTAAEGVRHIDRELAAFRSWLAPWTEAGHAPSLVEADRDARISAVHATALPDARRVRPGRERPARTRCPA